MLAAGETVTEVGEWGGLISGIRAVSSGRGLLTHLPLTVPYRSERLGPANRGAFRRHFRPGNRTLRNVPNGIANLYSQFPGNVKLRCRLPGKAGICRLHLMNSRSTRWTEEFQMVGADGVEWPRRRVCTPSKFLPPSQRRFCGFLADQVCCVPRSRRLPTPDFTFTSPGECPEPDCSRAARPPRQ